MLLPLQKQKIFISKQHIYVFSSKWLFYSLNASILIGVLRHICIGLNLPKTVV